MWREKHIGMGSDGSGGTVLKLTRMFRSTTGIDLSYCILRVKNAEKQGKGQTLGNPRKSFTVPII